jgi:hypothetical protein
MLTPEDYGAMVARVSKTGMSPLMFAGPAIGTWCLLTTVIRVKPARIQPVIVDAAE